RMARVAFGLKAHSGWAALVGLVEIGRTLEIVTRERLALVDAEDTEWAKAPYHAAEGLAAADAEAVGPRGVHAAHRSAERALRAAAAARRAAGDELVGCGLLVGAGMPDWSVAEVLAVHMRMHKAEGELFRGALLEAATRLRLPIMGIREKELEVLADKAVALPAGERAAHRADGDPRAGPPPAMDHEPP